MANLPSFATLNQTRPDSGIAEESRFQRLGISPFYSRSVGSAPQEHGVHDSLELWNWDGTLERVHHALYVAVREHAGREASPTAAIIDSQGAKGAEHCDVPRSRHRKPCNYDDRAAQNDGGQNDRFNVGYHRF
jgi:hypothetical protein